MSMHDLIVRQNSPRAARLNRPAFATNLAYLAFGVSFAFACAIVLGVL